MKQLLTLCMAAAMVGGAFSVDAKVTLRQAMQMKEEGKALTQFMNVRSRNNSNLKKIPAAPVSRFHKIQAEKAQKEAAMMKAPSKILPNGDAIYGYLYYSTNPEEMPLGLYEFNATQADLMWADTNETGYAPSSICYQNGTLKGYIVDTFWGMVFGIDYVEYDFKTGDILKLVPQDIDANGNYMQTSVLNTADNKFYGFGGYNGEFSFMWAPADDPFAYEGVPVSSDDIVLSMCYDAKHDLIYGVSRNYQLVTIDPTDGSFTSVMDLGVKNGAEYLTGMTYDYKSDLLYWNINYADDSAAMATIDVNNKKVDIYDELDYSEEYISLFTSDEYFDPSKPQRPEAGEVDFYKNSLSGIVSFTLPAYVGKDTPIEGKVEYRTYLDGQLYSTGTADAGSVVKASFTADEGYHVFGIRAVVNGVESAMATAKAWIGNDDPLAPTNVVLTTTELTWDAVEGGDNAGVHGGYVDGKAMTYFAKVYSGNEELAVSDALTATSFSVAGIIDEKADITAYTAEVVAVCNGRESVEASSNSVVAGEALKLPQYIEPTAAQFAISTVVDNNEDENTWRLVETETGNYISSGYSYDPEMPMDDWYFLPKMVFDDPSRFYSFSFEAALGSERYPEEYVEVLLCNEASPRGVVSVIIDEFQPESSVFQTERNIFQVRQPGEYYIAIHCVSEGDMLAVKARNFRVEDNNITSASPEVVSNLAAEGAAEGVLEASVYFTMPTTTMGGAELPADAVLKAVVASPADEVTVEGKPGEKMEVTVATVQSDNEITVVVSYGDLNSPVESTIVYTGVYVPATISSLTTEESADMLSLTLSWPAVTEADDPDGYIDPEEIVYDIYMVVPSFFGSAWDLYEPGVEGTSYTYSVEPGSPQDFVQLGVIARNAAGDNGILLSTYGILGTPYTLPMTETFDNAEEGLDLDPWVTLVGVGEPEFELYPLSEIDDNLWGDSDKWAMVVMGAEGDVALLSVPRFSTKGMNSAKFTLSVSGMFYLPKVTILGQVYGSDEYIEVGTMNFDEDNFDFQNVSVDLPAELCNQEWVGLVIMVEFETGNEALVIDEISATQGTGVASLATKGVKIAGGKNVINVYGLNGQNVTISTLDGRIAAKSNKVVSDATFNVEKGIYVVKAGEKNAKVIVK